MRVSGVLASLALAASLAGFAAVPARAVSISIAEFTPETFTAVADGLSGFSLETFEGLGAATCGGAAACEIAGGLDTAVGSFSSLGGTGSGGSVVGSGTGLSLKTAASGNAFGRSNGTPGGAWWLDSNDTFGIGWTVSTGTAFDVIAFMLSDAADVGATLTVSADGTVLDQILNRANATRSLVVISFGAPVLTAGINLRNDRLNDGLGIDEALVGIAPVPLPAGGLLLLSALGGVALVRRRRKG